MKKNYDLGVAQATTVVASPEMTKKDDFWGILQKSHRNQDAVISTGKFLSQPGEERHRLGSGYG